MEALLVELKNNYPGIRFIHGDTFKWSAHDNSITYADITAPTAAWSLLHELGHAELGHYQFDSDMELLQKESEAWSKAQELSQFYKLSISEDYISDCLDSYRDWVHKRSTCPVCGAQGIQKPPTGYECINCKTMWRVTQERLCRTYRRSS